MKNKYFVSIWIDGHHKLITNLNSWKQAQSIAELLFFSVHPLLDCGNMFKRSHNQQRRAGWSDADRTIDVTIGLIDHTFEY